MPKQGGNQCDWGVRNPSWQQQTGITNHAKQIPERGRGIHIRVLTFLMYTPNGSYDRALKNLCSLFHFYFSFSVAVNCTDCILEDSNSFPQVFLQVCFMKVSFMLTVLLHHLCYIFLLQLEAMWSTKYISIVILISQQNNCLLWSKQIL